MRPAHHLALALGLACALGLVAHRVAAPLPHASSAVRSPISVPVQAPARSVELAPPSLSPPAERVDEGLLLARRCLALAERDPLAAMEMALANQLQAVDSGLLPSLINQWAIKDFDGAYALTKTQEAGAWRDNMLAHLAYLRAKNDPLAAARLVIADISPGPARDEAIISVVHQWALQDTEAAGLWARSLADETLRQRASTEVASLAAAHSPAQSIR